MENNKHVITKRAVETIMVYNNIMTTSQQKLFAEKISQELNTQFRKKSKLPLDHVIVDELANEVLDK